MRVLVVEDDEFTRTLLVGAVTSLGHDCVAAVDGLHGWSHIQTRVPDVVVSDWQMPGLDGLELCARVRQLDRGAPIYFLLLTAGEDRHSALTAMEAGVDDYLLKPVDLEELQGRLVLARRWVELYRELAARSDELELLNVQLRESAERDPLTKVYNRLRLAEDLTSIADRVDRYGHRYAVALFDIDHFKSYNDTYGHIAGDEALIHVADIVRSLARAGDSVYRYGGEEFLLLLPEQNPDGARIAAERIREAVVAAPVQHRHLGVEGHVTVSAGIAGLGGPVQSFEEALHRADDALYAAKRAGRNCTVVAPRATEQQVDDQHVQPTQQPN
jgi:two-component system, cell cycle response regulator